MRRRCPTSVTGSAGAGATCGATPIRSAAPIFVRPGSAGLHLPPAAEAVDVRLRDPRSVVVEAPDTVPPPVERHWHYHTQPEYQDAVRLLVGRIRGRAP